jgi:hypothetical protein
MFEDRLGFAWDGHSCRPTSQEKGGTMFDMNLKNPMSTLKGATDTLANVGLEKTQEVLAQINLLLQLLQSAGYGVASLDIELSLPPKVTVKLKTTPAVKEEKLSGIVRDHGDQKIIAMVVASLIQANKLRGSVTVESLEMEGVEIIMTTTPNITLQWRDKNKKEKQAA